MNLSLPHEPAAWGALARALVVFGASFGFDLTAQQTAAIYGLVETLTTFFTRRNVTPNAKLSTFTVEAAKDVPPNPPV